jgi:hypothetical protein
MSIGIRALNDDVMGNIVNKLTPEQGKDFALTSRYFYVLALKFKNPTSNNLTAKAYREIRGLETPLLTLQENGVESFYQAFKDKISELNINVNSADFPNYLSAVIFMVQTGGSQSVSQKFEELAHKDAVTVFAAQPVKEITPVNFKSFIRIPTKDIQLRLRQTIRSKHSDPELKEVQMFYKDRNTTKGCLQGKKLRLELENLTLRGTNGFNGGIGTNGKIHTLFLETQAAREKYENVKTQYNVELHKFGNHGQIVMLMNEMEKKSQVVSNKEKQQYQLVQKSHDIMKEISTIDEQLAPLAKDHPAAAEFYEELRKPIDETNKSVQYTAMQGVLNS